MSNVSKKIDSLQLLRTIAVSLVILVHASSFGAPLIAPYNFVSSFYGLRTWGSLGVDLFFAISGFIMTIVTPSYLQRDGWKTFISKRAIRIVPLYYLITAVDMFGTLYVHKEHFRLAVLLKSIIFLPIFDQVYFVIPYTSIGWSLSYEMYFYILICILLYFRKNLNRNLLVLILLLSVIGVLADPYNVLLKFLLSPMLLEFGLGVICGIVYKKLITNKRHLLNYKKALAIGLLISGLGLLCVSIFIEPAYNGKILAEQRVIENNNIAAFYRAIIWGFPAALFLLGTILCQQLFNLKIPQFLVLCGDASYSCYLIHFHVYLKFAALFKLLSLNVNLYLILIIPLCLGVSVIFYKLVERPLTIGIDKLFKYRKPVVMN